MMENDKALEIRRPEATCAEPNYSRADVPRACGTDLYADVWQLEIQQNFAEISARKSKPIDLPVTRKATFQVPHSKTCEMPADEEEEKYTFEVEDDRNVIDDD
jgi:hypothetical protein